MSGIDRLIAYRTMRAVQEKRSNDRIGEMIAEVAQEEVDRGTPQKTRWQRWQAWVYRVMDRLAGL